jgi:periplasmic protein TonB
MTSTPQRLPEVFSPAEVARAAGVDRAAVLRLVRSGDAQTIDGTYLTAREAVRLVRSLQQASAGARGTLFGARSADVTRPGLPLILSGSLHALFVFALVAMTSIGFAKPAAFQPRDSQVTRLVFLATPGPGGGGGGGGARRPDPPPPALRKGASTLRSPLPIRRPPPADPPPVVRVSDPPPVKPEPLPPIVAPVVPVAADPQERVGVPADVPPAPESRGPGDKSGTGTGEGTGVGEGTGPGVGPGSGGGTGGGPYRPGSGITPPTLLREVKPDYTEEARRRSLEGDVVLEIVVRRDGSVGDVKILQGLGGGLDARAADAVRQWRFSPAQKQGVPVDVVVEVAVEFKLR